MINSGGFNGVPSIQFIYSDGTSEEIPLPSTMNPMEGVWVDNRLYFTDFGRDYSDKVYVLQGSEITDSFRVGPRPIGIVECSGYLFVASTGMDSLFNYSDGVLTRIDIATGEMDSLLIRSGASEISVTESDKIIVLSTGGWSGNAVLYKVDFLSMSIEDSIEVEETLYSLEVSDSLIWAGSWSGNLYTFSLSPLDLLETEALSTSINWILWDSDRSTLWITAGGYSEGPNYLIKFKEGKREEILLSDSDIGVGYLTVYETTMPQE